MRMKAFLVWAVAAWAATAFAEVPQVLTYRGVLTRSGGYGNGAALELTFRLYDSAAPDAALWARTAFCRAWMRCVFRCAIWPICSQPARCNPSRLRWSA